MSNVMISKSDFTVTVKKDGGRILSTAPITVKNQIREIRGIDDFDNVDTSQKQDGATFVYNATTGKYEVKLYNDDPLLNVQNLYVTTLWANNSRGLTGQTLFTNGNTIYWANGITKVTAGTGLTGGGVGDEVLLSVNSAYIATITANNTLFAYGKREADLSVNFSNFSGNTNFSFTSNNATFAYGKRESDLIVNFASFSGNSNFALTSNVANFALSAALANSGVIPGTYGNNTYLSVITVDQFGRINAISTSAIAGGAGKGVTSYTYSASNNTFTIDTVDNTVYNATIDIVKDFNVTGNLTVSGTLFTVNTQTITVNDAIIVLNKGQSTPFNDTGLILQRYAVANSINYNAAMVWNESERKLKFGRTSENGLDAQIAFTQEWLTIAENGNAIFTANTQAGVSVIATRSMVINSVSFTERNYPGEANTANTALNFNGIIDCGDY